MDELLEECLVARATGCSGNEGGGSSPHFSALCTSSSVHVCHHYYHHRQEPTITTTIAIKQHQHHNIRRGETTGFLSHSVSRADVFSLSRLKIRGIYNIYIFLNRLQPAGRYANSHSRVLFEEETCLQRDVAVSRNYSLVWSTRVSSSRRQSDQTRE